MTTQQTLSNQVYDHFKKINIIVIKDLYVQSIKKTLFLCTALQIDFARHSLDSVRIIDNLQDGLGILYSDIYSVDAVNTVKNSDFSQNGGSGISFKQLGMEIVNSRIENNKVAGIRHNPALSAVQQREFAGWFLRVPDLIDSSYNPIVIPYNARDIELSNEETKYMITAKVTSDPIRQRITIRVSVSKEFGILFQIWHFFFYKKIIVHF